MYAIAFDLDVEKLRIFYDGSYDNAYEEIRLELLQFGFERKQGSVYINESSENSLATVYRAINRLSSIAWFTESVRDIRVFKVEDWSDFTDIVKG